MHALNAGLVDAFPLTMREHAHMVAEAFPEPDHPAAGKFSVQVCGEAVTIPYRLYHSPSQIMTEHLTDLEKELVDCLLTRHHDGFVRQRHLEQIIRSGNSGCRRSLSNCSENTVLKSSASSTPISVLWTMRFTGSFFRRT